MPQPDDTRENPLIERSRMSFGEHLEELRRRVIWSLLGLIAATILCFHFGDHIIATLTAPYTVAMEELGFDPRMVQLNPPEAFIEYFKISLKFGLVLAAPWVLYQMWQFVATGLYPSERRLVRSFAPMSIFLFVLGASFMVTIVLCGLMKFLIGISMWFPLPSEDNWLYNLYRDRETEIATTTQPAPPPLEVPILTVDPESPADGQVWFNSNTGRLNVHHDGETYYQRLQKASKQRFVQPLFSVAQHLGFVVNLSLAFGFGFQIPIVVVFLISLRIVPAAAMARARKYVVLGIAVLAAILTPTPDVGTMLLLALPMILLFEVGLLIGRMIERRKADEPARP
jgi:sec-independent protein translocase protein TatC